MCVTAIIGAIGAAASVKSAVDGRKAAKEQAAQMREASDLAARQAAESARGNALAQQTAVERANAEAAARRNAEAAKLTTDTPEVELAASDPVESKRRRQVRASFAVNAEDGIGEQGAIRV